MAGTPTPLARMRTLLQADATLMAMLTGGVWDRELARTGPWATPTAYETTGAKASKPALVLIDGGDTADGLYRGAVFGHVDLWFYAPKDVNGNGRVLLANAYEQVKGLLFGWSFPMPNGTGATVDYVGDRLGPRDDPAEKGRIFDKATARYAALWRNLG